LALAAAAAVSSSWAFPALGPSNVYARSAANEAKPVTQPTASQGTPKPAAKPAAAAAAPKPRGRAAAKPAPKGPVAAKNVAVGAAAVAAAPAAFLAHGCMDSTHGQWLSNEVSGAAEVAANGDQYEAAHSPRGPSAGPSERGCVPFASVRSPSQRIEALALMPLAASPADGEARRAMVVSRPGGAREPVTRWHDLDSAVGPQREAWVPASSVLAGDAGDQIPARWLREVSLLVRQMKRQAQGDDSGWVRLVLGGGGADAARPLAVELVDAAGEAVDSAIWVDRDELPSGFVSARGSDPERLLWQSPVDYRRVSRGVGSATVIVRKRVIAAPKTPGGKPRVVVRSFRSRGQHQGIDFAAPTGTPVVTVADGTVVHAGRSGGYGNLVVVDHGANITTYYAHLSALGAGVHEGAKVERGQEIGLVGSTGMSTGPHLHFEIRHDGKYLDPADPKQTLPNWNLEAAEHEEVLTKLLGLTLSRREAFVRATRSPTLAAARAAASAASGEQGGANAE
jgi:murein DD-endopeptidase MepM/ murein hydrolase activator NlpD